MHVGSSSLTRDRTQVPCIGSVESYPLRHQGSSLSIIFSRFNHVYHVLVLHSFLLPSNISLYGYTIFIYLFINGWTFGLIPPWGYYEKCCYEHLCTSSAWMCVFISLGYIYLGMKTVKLPNVIILFNSLRNCQTVLQSSRTILHSQLQCMKVPISPHPQPKLVIVCLFYYSHACGCEEVSPCSFDVHFPND